LKVEGVGETAPTPNRGIGWLPLAGAVATILAVIATVAVTLGIHLDNKIGAVQRDVQGSNTRLQKVEDALKVLGNQQSDQTQKLIHELLATATKTKNSALGAKALEVASELTARLRDEKRSASPEFFRSAIESLSQAKQPALRTVAFAVQQQLAEYRSALTPDPPRSSWAALPARNVAAAMIVIGDGDSHPVTLLGGIMPFKPMPHAVQVFPNAKIIGGYFDVSPVSGDAFIVGAGRAPSSLPYIQDVFIRGGMQKLDGFQWKHVTFIGAHIAYKGGEVKLENVTFVNCTFDLPKDQRGSKVAQYVALSLPSLEIGASRS
jgi:hypothetical protein